ncbi:TPA: DUF3102 domain-containing protein [Streptococcus agalactiae]|nr:DUF3102 domain-containing protein [Streptococcus agalactiae]
MNEITLSDNLAQIELEINHHKQIAGQSIWEIGRRLNHVKEHDLAHGQFMEWLKKIEIDHTAAKRMMKVAHELPNSATLHHLGSSALYIIATLPDDQKQEQLDRIENGDNPTVRELQEIKRENNRLKAENTRLEQQKENLAEQALSAKVIEKEVIREIIPDDYESTKQLNDTLLTKNKNLSYDLETLERSLRVKENELKQLEEDSSKSIALKDAIESLQADKKKLETSMSNLMELNSMATEFEQFFDTKMAPMRFKTLIQGLGTEIQIDKIRNILTVVDIWLNEMNAIVPEQGRHVIEGEVING